MDKKQREVRRQQEDLAFKRSLIWVAGAIVLECLLMLVNRYYINYRVSEVEIAYAFHNGLKFMRIAGVAAAAAALVWTVLRARQARGAGLPLSAALGCGAVAVCAHVVLVMQDVGMSMLFWLVIAWAVLALIFYLYQREFFLAAAGVGLSILGLWFVRYQGGLRLESGLVLAGIAVVLAAAAWLRSKDGMLPGAKPVRFLPKDAAYPIVLVSCGAGLAAVVVGMLAGPGVSFYLIYLMLAWLFALFVYYTVKLM